MIIKTLLFGQSGKATVSKRPNLKPPIIFFTVDRQICTIFTISRQIKIKRSADEIPFFWTFNSQSPQFCAVCETLTLNFVVFKYLLTLSEEVVLLTDSISEHKICQTMSKRGKLFQMKSFSPHSVTIQHGSEIACSTGMNYYRKCKLLEYVPFAYHPKLETAGKCW